MAGRFSGLSRYWPWRFVRLPVLGFVFLSSVVILVLGATTLKTIQTSDPEQLRYYFPSLTSGYAGLAVGVACLTVLTVGPMLIIDYFRPGHFLSWVASELLCFTVLWILWLVTAGVASTTGCIELQVDRPDNTSGLFYRPVFSADVPVSISICKGWGGIEVLAFLIWLALMSYTLFLIYALMTRRWRGHLILWTATVRDTDFLDWKSDLQRVRSIPISFTITKNWPWTLVRLPIMAFLVASSAIVVGSAVYATSNDYEDDNDDYGAVAISSASITLASVLSMFLVDYFRPGSKTSWVAVELGWFSLLSLLWLSTALVATKSDVSSIFGIPCAGVHLFDATVCQFWQVIQAFAFLNFLFLVFYVCFLLACLSVRKRRGHKIFWTATVRDTDFLAWKGKKKPAPIPIPMMWHTLPPSQEQSLTQKIQTDIVAVTPNLEANPVPATT